MDANERRARVTDEASQWWARLGSRLPQEIMPQDRQQFTQWLRESPLHVAEMLHIAHVHAALERFKLWGEISTDTAQNSDTGNVVMLNSRPESRPDESRRWKYQAAAAALAVLVIAAGWLLRSLGGELIATDRAERREVMLNDGSVVQLEPETALRVRIEAHERRVTLERGRALFHVAKDPQRPFWVQADQTLVRAIGTAFGVERRPADIVVTVSEGKVAVLPAEESGSQTPKTVSASSTFLTANQQVTVPRSGATPVRQVDAGRALAWAQGRLIFDSVPLADVVEVLNRYNHVELRVDDQDLGRRPVSGVFQASDPETLIAFVRAGAHVKITRRGVREILIEPMP
jgi:transmembrane sensor